MLDQITATRYVTPLKEGGSLPGIVEADDLGTYVLKFRGAGQGLKVLVAEVIVGELARALGLDVPADDRRRPPGTHRQVRGRRGGPGPAHREPGPQPRHRLPARLVRLRRVAAPDARHRRRDPVARRPHRQRRPHVEQPEPPGLAPQPVADRPRRRALLPPRLAGPRRRPRAVRRPALRRQHPRPARRRIQPAAAHERLLPAVTAELLAAVVARGARRLAGAGTRSGLPRSRPRGLRRAPPGAASPTRRPGSRGTRHDRATATSTSSCAASPGSSARSSSTSASSSTARAPTSSRPPTASTRARLRALSPEVDVATSTRRSRPSARCAAVVTGGGLPTLGGLGRRFGWLSAPRSTVVQPGPVHGGLTDDPAAALARLVERLVG